MRARNRGVAPLSRVQAATSVQAQIEVKNLKAVERFSVSPSANRPIESACLSNSTQRVKPALVA
jgi:hypothetical protein